MRGRARGSVSGLRQNREDTKSLNTAAMMQVLEVLKAQKTDSLWTYKDVWSAAGLKSSVALNSPWNDHVRQAVDNHNKKIKEKHSAKSFGPGATNTAIDVVAELKNQLKKMTEQRDLALSNCSLYQADAEYYAKKYEAAVKVIERLRSERH